MSEPDFNAIKWHRVQTVPTDDKQYNRFIDFFNAMVIEYKHRIENNLLKSDHVIVTYQKNNYIQAVDLLPTTEQVNNRGFSSMVDKFVVAWCQKYSPKYLFRMSGAFIDEKMSEPGFVMMAEDSEEFYMKKFRVDRNTTTNTMELIEVSSEREAGSQEEAAKTSEERMKERDRKEDARRKSKS
jgi:hypothetical protein